MYCEERNGFPVDETNGVPDAEQLASTCGNRTHAKLDDSHHKWGRGGSGWTILPWTVSAHYATAIVTHPRVSGRREHSGETISGRKGAPRKRRAINRMGSEPRPRVTTPTRTNPPKNLTHVCSGYPSDNTRTRVLFVMGKGGGHICMVMMMMMLLFLFS